MAGSRRGVWVVPVVLAGSLLGAATATGQGMVQPGAMVQDGGSGAPAWIAAMAADPNSPEMRALAAQNKERRALEQQVRLIRHQFIKSGNAEKVQEGFARLRDLVAPNGEWKPAAFPMLLEVFERDSMEVRTQVLDLIRDSKSDQGDTTLAWAAVMSKEKDARAAAKARLLERVGEREEARATDAKDATVLKASNGATTREVSPVRREYPAGVAMVVNEGLRTRREHTMAAAADLANVLGMFEAIPGLIAGQVSGAGFGGGGAGTDRTGDIAWIMVAQQQTYIADLTPVVGEGAVGFDPTVGVVSEGVLLRVKDAAVFAYSFDVHGALVALADTATGASGGQTTASMGFDTPKWLAWYEANKQAIAAKATASKQ